MSLPLALALLDAAAASYLLGWVLRREPRNRLGVVTVGVMLAVCAMALAVVAWPDRAPAPQPVAPQDVPGVGV